MRAEVVGVGTELLLGQIANTNARWISERLAAVGVDVLHHQAVGDNVPRIVDALRVALDRADIVLVTGGLGPTEDDLTRDAIGELLGLEMIRHPEIEDLLREKFAGYGRGDMPLSNLRQADVPEGLRTIVPVRGTAPGLVAELPDGKRVYAVPGVPVEMEEMMEGTILPELAALAGPATIVSRTLRSASLGESRVAEKLRDLFEASSNPSVAYLASSSEVKVRLTAKAATREEAESLLAPLAAEVRGRLGDAIFTVDDEELEEAVGRLLRAAGETLACAESLTGGRGRGPSHVDRRRIGLLRRLGGRVYGRDEAGRARRDAGDDRRSRRRERGVRSSDGRRGAPAVRRGRRPGVDGRRRPRASRRCRSRNRMGGGRRRRRAVRAPDQGAGRTVPRPSLGGAGGARPGPAIPRRRAAPRHGRLRQIRVAADPGAHADGPHVRLFLGVEVSPAAEQGVAAAIRPWREAFRDARWVPPKNWHVTLKFLGWTSEPLVSWVEETVEGIVGAHPPVAASVRGLGAFPSAQRARVLWAGIDDPANGFGALVADLEAGLAEEFRAELRRFHPHLTVARSEPPLRLPEAYADTPLASAPFVADRVVLFRSHLEGRAARYEPLRTFPLEG